MKIKSVMTVIALCGAMFSAAVLTADEAPAAPSKKAAAKGKRPDMRRGGMNRFNPAMMLAFAVGKELKAYNENKTEENYKKLEEAVKAAANKMTEEFLAKAKAGEITMSAAPGRRPGRGGRGGKGAKRPAPAQD